MIGRMNNISKQEKEFLRKVYCKASYLEYEKIQQELIKENEKQIKKRKIKNCAILGFLFIIASLASAISHFDAFVIMVSSIFLMIVVSYYEFNFNMR